MGFMNGALDWIPAEYIYICGAKRRWLVTRESMVVQDADDGASCIEKASFRGRNKNYQCVFCSIG